MAQPVDPSRRGRITPRCVDAPGFGHGYGPDWSTLATTLQIGNEIGLRVMAQQQLARASAGGSGSRRGERREASRHEMAHYFSVGGEQSLF
ncbi:hypothetical protein Rmet_6643 (plasmid) [Cupriavidus metallidurans CH34]|uniref:Uncharacterized protein n=1 Tax=Cupriavidus metallidurans (strain ATCC 43123 / DSM 2839 / NBRC 102507 / CH34) TaxID=266264 RepID=D3DY73_CUPMC|nr:hypothetical protein Rmet_6643 [Cupriavidus metallidurans CH34]